MACLDVASNVVSSMNIRQLKSPNQPSASHDFIALMRGSTKNTTNVHDDEPPCLTPRSDLKMSSPIWLFVYRRLSAMARNIVFPHPDLARRSNIAFVSEGSHTPLRNR